VFTPLLTALMAAWQWIPQAAAIDYSVMWSHRFLMKSLWNCNTDLIRCNLLWMVMRWCVIVIISTVYFCVLVKSWMCITLLV